MKNVIVRKDAISRQDVKAGKKPRPESWHQWVDGIHFFSFISYEDLQRKIREYLETRN